MEIARAPFCVAITDQIFSNREAHGRWLRRGFTVRGMDGSTGGVNLQKVALTEQCLKDFSLIIHMSDAKTITNGIILHLKGRFSIQDLYKIIEKRLPVPATTSEGEASALNENSFSKRLKVFEGTVKRLNKSKKNHDRVNDLLAEPFS